MPRRKKPIELQLKRVYEPPAKSDGCRVLVDRIWPRGLSRDGNAKGVRLRFFPPSWLDWGGGAGFLLLDDN